MKTKLMLIAIIASALLCSCQNNWTSNRQRWDKIYAELLELLKQIPPEYRMQALESFDTTTRSGGYTSFTYTQRPQPQYGTITTINPNNNLAYTTAYTVTPQRPAPYIGYSFDNHGNLTPTIYADPWTVTFGDSNED
jgi:outer membrane biogenesis lipoprotein LolB